VYDEREECRRCRQNKIKNTKSRFVAKIFNRCCFGREVWINREDHVSRGGEEIAFVKV